MRKLFVIVLLAAPSLAHADPSPARDASAMHSDDCARTLKLNRPCKILDMGKGDRIDGDRPTNDDIRIDIIQHGKHDSLIRIRRDFIVEILKTAEDL